MTLIRSVNENRILTSPQFFCENTLPANRCAITVTSAASFAVAALIFCLNQRTKGEHECAKSSPESPVRWA
jgi:hypothetical protein